MNTSPSLDKTRTPQMFTSIARRYDLLNHLLSLNIDRSWRSRLVASAGIEPGQTVVDAATGTADVAIAFARQTEASRIIGIDRSTGMLDVGREKVDRLAMAERVRLVEGDCLALPVADGIADAATIAFGLRNLPDYGAGVAEMARVLKPGGRLLVLEFFPPRGGGSASRLQVLPGPGASHCGTHHIRLDGGLFLSRRVHREFYFP